MDGRPRRADDVALAGLEVEVRPADAPGFAAVVALRGEHDLATAPAISETLSSLSGNVLVDLSDCTFIDSTVIGSLIRSSRALERDGHRLEVLVPPENQVIMRTLEVVNLRDLIVVHSERPGPSKG